MAARISGWLVVLLVLEIWLVIPALSGASQGAESLLLIVLIASLIFVIWAISLVSVVWHRYILLEELPSGIIPYHKGLNVWSYFRQAFVIAMILVLVAFAIGIFIGIVVRPDTVAKEVLLGLFTGIIVTLFFYRLALILPSVALNKNMTYADALKLTKGYIPTIFGLVIATVFFNLGANLVIDSAFGVTAESKLIEVTEDGVLFAQDVGNLPLYIFISGALQWFVFMMNISILTTLYGHIVEKREIY